MSDEPYRFGPTDPRAGSAPDGRPPLPIGTEPSAPAGEGGPPAADRYRSAPSGGVPYYGPPLDHGAAPTSSVPTGERPAAGSAEPAPWGARVPVEGHRRMSTVAKSLAAVGVAALIAVGGTIAVTSASADNTSTSAPSGAQPMGGYGAGSAGGTGSGTSGTGTGRSGRFGGGMASRSLIAGALHGEFVVADGTGTKIERLQTGAVTSVSSTSVTVKSTDDFTATYTLPSGTDVSGLATGTTVTVIATVDGSTLTVVSISAAETGSGTGDTGRFTPPDGAIPGGGGFGTSGRGTGTGATGTDGNGTDGAGSGPGTDGTGTGTSGSTAGSSTSGSTGGGSGV